MIRTLRIVAALLLITSGGVAHAQCSGYFDSGYVDTGYYDVGYLEDGSCVVVPDVTDQVSSAAADVELEALGIDLGTATARCSSEMVNYVTDQSPPAGTIVALASLVNVFTSNGSPCEGRPPLWLHLERLR